MNGSHRTHSPTLAYSLALLSVFCILPRAQAEEKNELDVLIPRVSFCAGVLSTLIPAHSMRSVSEAKTQETISQLREFRIRSLKAAVVEPRISEFDFRSSDLVEKQRLQLASQIRGLELNAHNFIDREGQQITMASVIPREQTTSFFNDLSQHTDSYSKAPWEVSPITLSLRGVLALLAASSLLTEPSPFTALATIGLAGFVGVDRPYWIFKNSIFNLEPRLQEMQRIASAGSPGEWRYLSFGSWVYSSDLSAVIHSSPVEPSVRLGHTLLQQESAFIDQLGFRLRRGNSLAERRAFSRIWIHTDLLATAPASPGADPLVFASVRFSLKSMGFPDPEKGSSELRELGLRGSLINGH